MDPIELRIRNEPEKGPVSGLPLSSRNVAEADRTGAERFGLGPDATPSRQEGERLIGLGVATATYPYYRCRAALP